MLPFPQYVDVVFMLTTLLTVWLFYRASHRAWRVLAIALGWMAVQTGLGLSGFYLKTDSLPPHFVVLIGPPLLLLTGLLTTRRGRHFLDTLRLDWLTVLHTIRIPVELVLFWLFLHKAIPQSMTFEGHNFDILSGLTAPIMYYVAFRTKVLPRRLLLIWNLLCLGLLAIIVGTAVLSAPSPFQQLAFDQPNVAILYFPFVWLPSVIVPIVLLAHVAAIRQLTKTADP